jgi:hypothetical protein
MACLSACEVALGQACTTVARGIAQVPVAQIEAGALNSFEVAFGEQRRPATIRLLLVISRPYNLPITQLLVDRNSVV